MVVQQIGIADKQTLDSIKSDTTQILNKLGAVKSVQRGVVVGTSTITIQIPISAIDPSKSSVNLYGVALTNSSGTYDPIVNSLTSTVLTIESGKIDNGIIHNTVKIGWEIVEYY